MPALWTAVPDTNEEGDNSTTDVTFTAKFCDPYFGNNYCQFNTSHPKLFSIYLTFLVVEEVNILLFKG
jgi:hypothetical protein